MCVVSLINKSFLLTENNKYCMTKVQEKNMNFDLTEMRWFFDNFKPLNKLDFEDVNSSDEAYALIIQARNKYLAEDEKNTIHLKASKGVIDSSIIKTWSWEHFLSHVLYFDRPQGAYITPDGVNIPEHVLAFYFMYNPRTFKDAALQAQRNMNDYIYDCLEDDSKTSFQTKKNLFRSTYAGKNAFLQAAPVKNYVDIDIDVEKKTLSQVIELKAILNLLENESNEDPSTLRMMKTPWLHKPFLIESSCGYHALVPSNFMGYIYKGNKNGLKDMFNIEYLKDISSDCHNFIPLPGSSRNGFIVRVLNKEQFK